MDNPKSKLKINNTQSMFEKPQTISAAETQHLVNENNEHNIDYSNRALELSTHFKKMLEDKTLVVNKNSLSYDIERDIINKLTNLAIEINNDPHEEQDGTGSIGLILLLFRTAMQQRDRINQLDFETHELTGKIKSIEEQLTKIYAAIDISKTGT